MTSAIDATKPIAGSPTTQSVRDNFAAAASEITALQAAAAAAGDITGVTAGAGLSGGGTSGSVTLSLTSPVAVANGGTGTTTAFTAGSVLFATAGGVYGQDHSFFTWDGTNHRLGVGTTAPGSMLSVGGNMGMDIGSVISFTGANTALDYSNYALYGDSTSTAVNTPSGGSVQFKIGNTERARVHSNGNVGIGTTTPGAKLDVAAGDIRCGDDYTTGAFKIGSNGSSLGRLNTDGSTRLQTGQGSLLLNPAGGNVGIGTTTPGAKLDVAAGDIRCGDDYTTGAFKIGSIGSSLGRVITDGSTRLQTGQGSLLLNPAGGNVGIGTTTPSSHLTIGNNTSSGFLNTYAEYQILLHDGGTAAASYGFGVEAAGTIIANSGNAHRWDVTANTTVAVFDSASTRNVSGAWATISDREMKQADSIVPYTRGLDAITKLNPCMFRYVSDSPFARADEETRDPLIGLIADEVQPHVPEIVGETTTTVREEERTISTLQPGLLVFSLINAVKTLAEQNTALTARIAALETPAE